MSEGVMIYESYFSLPENKQQQNQEQEQGKPRLRNKSLRLQEAMIRKKHKLVKTQEKQSLVAQPKLLSQDASSSSPSSSSSLSGHPVFNQMGVSHTYDTEHPIDNSISDFTKLSSSKDRIASRFLAAVPEKTAPSTTDVEQNESLPRRNTKDRTLTTDKRTSTDLLQMAPISMKNNENLCEKTIEVMETKKESRRKTAFTRWKETEGMRHVTETFFQNKQQQQQQHLPAKNNHQCHETCSTFSTTRTCHDSVGDPDVISSSSSLQQQEQRQIPRKLTQSYINAECKRLWNLKTNDEQSVWHAFPQQQTINKTKQSKKRQRSTSSFSSCSSSSSSMNNDDDLTICSNGSFSEKPAKKRQHQDNRTLPLPCSSSSSSLSLTTTDQKRHQEQEDTNNTIHKKKTVEEKRLERTERLRLQKEATRQRHRNRIQEKLVGRVIEQKHLPLSFFVAHNMVSNGELEEIDPADQKTLDQQVCSAWQTMDVDRRKQIIAAYENYKENLQRDYQTQLQLLEHAGISCLPSTAHSSSFSVPCQASSSSNTNENNKQQ